MRGAIAHRARARQLHDFTGLRWGRITPMNLDGSIDFKDKAFVWFDTKLDNAPLHAGERLHLERLASRVERSGCPAIVLIARHHEVDPDDDIDAAACTVTEFFYRGEWREPQRKLSLREAIDSFLASVGLIIS